MSEKVINPWNVNMSVIDDVQNRFQSGEYQQEIEVFGFLLYKEGKTTACAFADKDSCYQAYYRESLIKESYLSAVSGKCTVQSEFSAAKLKTCMDDFTQELAQKDYLVELLADSSKYSAQPKAAEELFKMAEGDLDIISWLLSEKFEIKNRNEYITERLKQYEQGRAMRFFDMRVANVLERREELAVKGIASLLIYLGKKELGYGKLKEILSEKEDNMRKLWQNLVAYRPKMLGTTFNYQLKTDDELEKRTFLKYEQLFAQK